MQDPITMYHPGLPGSPTQISDRIAYRTIFYALGWRSNDDPTFGGVDVPVPSPLAIQAEKLLHQPALVRMRQKIATARAGGFGANIFILGDSYTEGYNTGKFRNRWPDRLRRRLQGFTTGSIGLIPASANTLNSTADVDWPGGDSPWTYAGSITTAINYGFDYHAVNIPSGGGSATITYFGDKIDVVYTRSTGGPTACAVTLDGAAQTAINANGSELLSQRATYGTNGDYSFHTLVVTPNSGTLIFEGVQPYDGDVPFFFTGSVAVVTAAHAGFAAQTFADPAINNWSGFLTGGEAFDGLMIIALGLNDINFSRTVTQFQNDLVTIMQRVDARLGVSNMCYLLMMMPGTSTLTLGALQAAARIGLTRCAVLDLNQFLAPNGTLDSALITTTHPNDYGQAWMADVVGQIIDPNPVPQPVTPIRQQIDSSTPTTSRLNWTEAWTQSGYGGYDASATSGVAERRHRMWLDAGTYRATVTNQHGTTRGTCEVLIGRWNNATAQLVSCGTVATDNGGADTDVTTRLATTVVNDCPGWVPVVIRRTAATSGAVRFRRLVLDKVA